MGRKSKYSKELKIEICKRYLNGEGSTYSLADEIGTNNMVVYRWVKKYNAFGESAFDDLKSNNAYTKTFKQMVVDAYLNGEGSLDDLAIKYNISSNSTIIKWIKDYNSHMELKDYIPGGEDIYMAKSRKVNKEERIEIVKYCLEHDLDYKTTAKVFETTYANVFNWVKKYEEVDEMTLLKRQLKQKEYELEMALLEVRMLKKLDEIERRRYTEKANMKKNMKQSKKLAKKK